MGRSRPGVAARLGLALASLVAVAAPARGQDASVLFYFLLPALLLTPPLAVAIRRPAARWWGAEEPRSWARLVGLATLEMVVWGVLLPLGAGIHVGGRWVPQPGLAVGTPVALLLGYLINRWGYPTLRSARSGRGGATGHLLLAAFAALLPLCFLAIALAALGVLAVGSW